MNRVVPALISEGLIVSTLFQEAASVAKGGAKAGLSWLLEGARQRDALRRADMWLQEQPASAVRSFLNRIEPARMTSVTQALCGLADDLDGSRLRGALRVSFRNMATSSEEHPICDAAAEVLYEAVLRALAHSKSALAERASALLIERTVQSLAAGTGIQFQQVHLQLDAFRAMLTRFNGPGEQQFQPADADVGVLEQTPLAVSSRAPRTVSTSWLIERLGPASWVALNGSHGCGKTQLALQVAESLRTRTDWLSLRDVTGDRAEASIVTWRHRTLGDSDEQALLIVDDLPQFESGSRFESILANVAATLLSRGSRLLTLSTYRLPRSLEERATVAQQCPIFSAAEIGEYLAFLDAPEKVRATGICAFYEALTQGNALLVRTMVDYLSKQNWSVSETQLTDLLQQKHAADVSDQILRRIVSTVPRDDARALLFRLALWVGPFDQSGLEAASKVEPRVQLPGECVALLRDTWMESLNDGLHRVVGTVKAIRPNPLPNDVLLATEEAFGDTVFFKKSITPRDAFVATTHYFAAKRYGKAATVLIFALSNMVFQPVLKSDFDLLDFVLPDETELVNLLPVLALQTAVGGRLAQDVGKTRERLMALLPMVREEHGWSIAGTAVMCVPALSLCDPELAVRILTQTIELLPNARGPSGKPYELPNDVTAPELPLIGALFVRTGADIVALVQTLRLMNREAIRPPQKGRLAELTVAILTSNYVATERDRSASERNWQQVRQTLQLVGAAARELEWVELGATAARSDVLLLSEHMGNPSGARQLAAELELVYAESNARLLLRESVLRTYLHEGNWKSANEVLNELLPEATTGTMKTILHATVDVGLACTEPHHAALLLGQGRSLALNMSESSTIERVRILGELARASIEADDWQTAFDAAELSMRALEAELDQPTEAWKACAVCLWHIGTYVAFCMQGLRTKFDVRRPPNGLMFTEDALAHLFTQNRRGTAYLWHANMAEMVEQLELADEWRGKGVAMVASLESPDILRLSQVAKQVCLGDFEGAIAVCEGIGGPFHAHAGITTIVVPAMALYGLRLKEGAIWQKMIKAVQSAHVRLGKLDDSVSLFEVIAASLEHEKLLAFGQDKETGLWATTVLAASADPALPVQHALTYQFSVFMRLWPMFQQQTPIRARLALPFLTSFWDDAVKRAAFMFRSPQYTRAELERTSSVHPARRIRHVLGTIVSGLGARLPANAHAWLYANET